MSIIEAIRPDGCNVMLVQPDKYTEKAVSELKKKGCTNIHNSETGEKYL